MRRRVVFVLVLLGISVVSASSAQQMAIWDFGSNAANYTTGPNAVNANVIGTPTLVPSGGTLDPDGKDGTAYVDVLNVSHIAGQSAAWDEIKVSGDNARWITTIDTVGWQDISLRFDYKAWSSKTTSFDIDYRLNDTDAWTNILNNTPIVGDSTFHPFAYSLASLDAIENQPVVELRFNDFDNNKGSGKLAFDNFELTGTLIPEPATIALLVFGAAAFSGKRRK